MQVRLRNYIEALRVSTMCTADVQVYSFFRSNADVIEQMARSNALRKCWNWSVIKDRSRQ